MARQVDEWHLCSVAKFYSRDLFKLMLQVRLVLERAPSRWRLIQRYVRRPSYRKRACPDAEFAPIVRLAAALNAVK